VLALKKETEKAIQKGLKEKDERIEQLTQQVAQLEGQWREANDQVKQKDHEIIKENAIKSQKIQFLEMQLGECREQLEEAYKQHDSMVKAMNEPSPRKDDKKGDSPSKLEALQNEL